MADEALPNNPVPERLARAVPTHVPALMQIGPSFRTDVYVTAAEDLEGLSASEISHCLGVQPERAFYVIEFPADSIKGWVASPVFREDQCFVGGGRTRGGAREFIIPNQSIPAEATIREVH